MSTLCNTPHPDFPAVVCRVNRGDHRNAEHKAVTPHGTVIWPMSETVAAFVEEVEPGVLYSSGNHYPKGESAHPLSECNQRGCGPKL